jgi:DnaA-homolog protein
VHQLPLGVQLRASARFDTFLPGTQPAALATVAAVRALALGEARAPLWIWGAGGAGKTHLLQAALADGGAGACAYLPLALPGLEAPMLQGLEAVDLLAIDDVDALAGRGELEEAMFHLWNRALERGGRLLLAARQPPAGVPVLLRDLASRFSACLVMHLPVADDADLPALLQGMAAQRGMQMPDEVAAFLLRRVAREPQALAALVQRLDGAALAAQRALTVPFVREVLGA